MSSSLPTATRLPIRSQVAIAGAAPISAQLSAKGLATDWVQLDPRAPSQLWRSDMAHATLRSLGGSLTWTAIVAPISPIPLQSTNPPIDINSARLMKANNAKPQVRAIDRPKWKPAVRPLRSSQPAVEPLKSTQIPRGAQIPEGIVRQRFYPAQWQLSIRSRMDSRAHMSHQQVQWVGWDRSLPRMYLSAELLTQVFVDLIEVTLRNLGGSARTEAPLSIRVAAQSGAARRLVLVISHPRLQLSANHIQEINSSHGSPEILGEAFPNVTGWQRIFDSVSALSGSLSTAQEVAGGTLLRLSIPTDDRLTLVDSWMQQVQAMHEQSRVGRVHALPVSMHLLGWQPSRPARASTAIDARLQAMAGRNDFVYRAARNRWLWLSTEPGLPRLVFEEGWRTAPAQQWSLEISGNSSGADATRVRWQLSKQIAASMERALGCRVPPLDDLMTDLKRLRLFRLDAPAPWLAEPKFGGSTPTKAGSRVPHAHFGTSAQRRWRYPI